MKTTKDWIALVEASYDLESSPQACLDGLVQRVVPLIDRPASPVSLFTYRCTPTTLRLGDIAVHGPPIIASAIRETNAAASVADLDLIYRGGIPGGTLSEHVFSRSPQAREIFFEKTGRHFRDTFGWIAHSGADLGLMVNASLVVEECSTAAQRRLWSRVAAHLGAGLRLRAALILAVRNDPAHADPRGLTQHERQIAEFLGLGHGSKSIAYTLGTSPSSVDNAIASVAAKLGLASRAELTAFFSPAGARAKLAEVAVAGEHLLVGAYPLADGEAMALLSEAERAVVALIVLGSTNAHIAAERGTTERTVANQMQSIFRKLCARSRSELAIRIQAGA